jgi:glycosyltransferase involved in cell wall biosynthesis
MPWLEDQLRALADQECDDEWEVVIADNGSTDQSREVAAHWSEQHGRIRWIDASAVPGAPAARNAGARAARGDLLAFCDCRRRGSHPGWLASCARALGSADVVAGIFDFWSLNGLQANRPRHRRPCCSYSVPAGRPERQPCRSPSEPSMRSEDSAEELVTGEDIDLCWRLQTHGLPLRHRGSGAVVSKRGRSGFVDVFKQGAAFGRGGPVLYRRHRGAGARRNLASAAKSWLWLVARLPLLFKSPAQRNQWARAAGVRTGRLAGSVTGAGLLPVNGGMSEPRAGRWDAEDERSVDLPSRHPHRC